MITMGDQEGPFYESSKWQFDKRNNLIIIVCRIIDWYNFLKDSAVMNTVVPDNELNDPNTKILLEGSILSKNCQLITNAAVDIWYAGPGT